MCTVLGKYADGGFSRGLSASYSYLGCGAVFGQTCASALGNDLATGAEYSG